MRKLITITIMIILIASITAFAVSAAGEVTVSDLSLGSDSQKRSNPRAKDDDAKVENITDKITIKNNAATELSAISFTAPNINSKFAIEFSNVPATLAAGASAQVDVGITIPGDFNSFDDSLSNANSARSFSVGEYTASGTVNSQTVTDTGAITLEVENKLTFRKVRLDINGKRKNVEDGDNIEVRPGDQITLIVEVENEFSTNNNVDIDMDNVEVEIDIDDDSDFNIDDSTLDFGGVNANKEEEKTTSIDLEEDAKRESHLVKLLLTGEDDNGAKHGELFEFDIDVDRKDNDIKIQSIDLSPDPVTCNTRSVDVNVRILNIGQNDEEEVSIKAEVPGLNFKKREYDIVLDEDDDASITFSIDLPDDYRDGDHPVSVESYYDRTKLSGSEATLLTLPKCKEPEPEPVVVQQPTPVQQQPVTPEPVVQPTPEPIPETVESEPVRNSNVYLWILGVIIVILLVAVIVLAIKFVFVSDK